MRTANFILLVGVAVILLSCGLFDGGQESAGSDDEAPLVVSGTPPGMEAPITYDGPSSLEERIFASPVIARVRLDSATSAVESATTYHGMKYVALLEFDFLVLEYLKGSGASDIAAVWAAAPFFDTRQEAEAALPALAAARNTQWDDHEAIIFLQQDSQGFLASTQQASRYYLAWGGSWPRYSGDDGYSIASRHNKLWLPAEAAVGAPSQLSGNQQRFLMDVPPATGTAPTITLGEVKTRIAAVTAKLNAGDGSEEYTECVQRTYWYEGINRYRIERGDEGFFYRIPDQELDSGLATSSVVYEQLDLGGVPDSRDELWFDGGDGALFNVEFGESVPYDFSGDGTNDSIQYAQRVVSARPLPTGAYKFHLNHRDVHFVPCDGYTTRYEWTVTVNAPEGTLHEAFFDPVTVGSAVAADGANGVLKPASFTDSNGATSTIERIAWEAPSTGSGQAGTVKLRVSPHDGIAGHVVDFIELDGTVSLSLNADEATADAANDALSWVVASQPWEDGDTLMLRIREVRDAGSNRTVVPNPGENPGLVSDCVTLLTARDVLRGTAPLNWSVERRITSWDGVTVEDAPKRVTILDLNSRDPTMDRLDAVMDMSFEIRDEDIEQLKAIYLLHNSH